MNVFWNPVDILFINCGQTFIKFNAKWEIKFLLSHHSCRSFLLQNCFGNLQYFRVSCVQEYGAYLSFTKIFGIKEEYTFLNDTFIIFFEICAQLVYPIKCGNKSINPLGVRFLLLRLSKRDFFQHKIEVGLLGCRRSSVDSSAAYILSPLVRIPSTPFMLLSIWI